MMLADKVQQLRKLVAAKASERERIRTQLEAMQKAGTSDQGAVDDLVAQKRRIDQELDVQRDELAVFEQELERDEVVQRLSNEIYQGAPGLAAVGRPATAAERSSGTWIDRSSGQPATVARDQRLGDHRVVQNESARTQARDQAIIGAHGNLDTFVRSLSTTGASAVIPTVWAADVIDRARNFAAVLQAGAEIVPMDAKVVQIGRLTGDPTAAFRTEGSTITASDPTFDNVTLTATTMSALTVMNLEFYQDSIGSDDLITEAMAKQFALTLDLVSLYGSITSGSGSINLPTPPNPRGVLGALLASAATSVLPSSGAATNGTAQTTGSFWNEVLDAIFTVRDNNETPNAMLWSSKLARKYAKTYDTQGQPLRRPADVDALQQYVTNQIPSYTQGTMSNVATDLFVGDWTKLIIGQRMDLSIQVLTERYAENGQIGIVANWRGDVQLARPRAFSVYRALQGS